MADSDVLDNLEILLASTNGLNCVGEYIRNLAVTGRLTANFEPSDSVSDLLSSSVLSFPVNSDSSEERFAIPDTVNLKLQVIVIIVANKEIRSVFT